jgi:4-hydroxybenzoate polyprenyltransferase
MITIGNNDMIPKTGVILSFLLALLSLATWFYGNYGEFTIGLCVGVFALLYSGFTMSKVLFNRKSSGRNNEHDI